MTSLLSEKNPLLREVRRASAQGALTRDGFAIAEGFHLLEEALAAACEMQAVIAGESAWDRLPQSKLKQTRVVQVSDRVLAQLTSADTPQGVVTLVRPASWTLDQLFGEVPLVVVLDRIQDPGNAGAIVRAAEAFGATGAAFLKGSVSPYNPKCLRASAGSLFRVPFVPALEERALLAAVQRQGLTLFAAMPRATTPVSRAKMDTGCAILIGSEGQGVRPSLAHRAAAINIPATGVESLNAAVAAGIILYEARRQRCKS